MLRGALIGVGHVARNGHLPVWSRRTDATLAAAADARPDGREALLAAFPGARWYGSAEELLAREALDFVDVCTPPALHAAITRAALASGCHVLCEKPLVLSPGDLPGLEAAARERGGALVTVHNWKNAPALSRITELVREGAIGRILRCRWETLRTKPAVTVGEAANWRVDPVQSGGGVLVDHGWHAFYVLRQWFGGDPATVSARLTTEKHHDFPAEDTARVSFEWSGAAIEVLLTWAASERANRITLEGERGRVSLDGGCVKLESAAALAKRWDLPSIAEGSHHPEWFAGVVEEFFGEIEDPERRGSNLRAASLCATLVALSQDSSRRGGAVLEVPGR